MNSFYRQFGYVGVGWGRTHHPEIIVGIWRSCVNGLQFFCGRALITIHWPVGRKMEIGN